MLWNTRIRRRLKLRDLDALVAVARHGSMAKAAIELSVSQPAVSKAIASIEHTLGVRLLDRTAQGVEPNLYGTALLKWAVAVFDDVKQGVNEIEFLASPGAGEVRIGAGPQIVAGILPKVLTSLGRDYPRVVYHVSLSGDGAQQYRELHERNVDVIVGRILDQVAFEDEIETEILFEDPLFVVSGANNPLARRRKLSLRDLEHEPWTLPSYAHVTGSFIAKAFQADGLDPPVTSVTCSSFEMYTALLSEGPYLAFCPRSVLMFSAMRSVVRVLPVNLSAYPPPAGILTWKNRTISPVVQLFIDRFRQLAKPLVQAETRAAQPQGRKKGAVRQQ
jgi:DNA-binding transcriptional LysR family regulator